MRDSQTRVSSDAVAMQTVLPATRAQANLNAFNNISGWAKPVL
jgi:hypothetical protein